MNTSTARSRRHRERLVASGYRLVQLRVPDTRTPEFAARIARQMEALRRNRPSEAERSEAEFWDSLVEPSDEWR